MTFEEIAKAALGAPFIRTGFVHQCIALDDVKSTKIAGGGNEREAKWRTHFRVCLYDYTEWKDGMKPGAGCADIESPDLMNAIRTAFEKLKITLPASLKPKKK